ncbi:unnamed protein product [Protopolystoma xenopodis]|uniref:Uncharacterized protein n=1 Tax=Protopolystoma xenopodis TaxID=117903 RepID=A0A448WYV8_9PLAT|nr:unnamed protein product [Protopolystoma xenopodis]
MPHASYDSALKPLFGGLILRLVGMLKPAGFVGLTRLVSRLGTHGRGEFRDSKCSRAAIQFVVESPTPPKPNAYHLDSTAQASRTTRMNRLTDMICASGGTEKVVFGDYLQEEMDCEKRREHEDRLAGCRAT